MAHRSEREKLQETGKTCMTFTSLKDFPKATLEVMRQTKFIYITLAGCTEASTLSGMSAFLTKLLNLQFGLTPSEVALYMCKRVMY